jgi:tRNA threonylcarbamoyladenosine biosynthesis protein TsaE
MSPNKGETIYCRNYTLKDIEKVAREIVEHTVSYPKLWLWDAEMGAGKTTMVAAICRKLGSNDIVNSPTYGFVNIYDSPKGNICHIDAYRIEDESEAVSIGLEDYLFDEDNYCFVEWPSKISTLFPERYLYCNLVKISDKEREIYIISIP